MNYGFYIMVKIYLKGYRIWKVLEDFLIMCFCEGFFNVKFINLFIFVFKEYLDNK